MSLQRLFRHHEPKPELVSFAALNEDDSSGGFSLTRMVNDLRSLLAAPKGKPQTAEIAHFPAAEPVQSTPSMETGIAAGILPGLLSSEQDTNSTLGPHDTLSEVDMPPSHRSVISITNRLKLVALMQKDQKAGPSRHRLRRHWMPDEHCKVCYECNDRFNTFRRRHHCRICGHIFCSTCCYLKVPGTMMGYGGEIRVCNYCYKIVQSNNFEDIEKSLENLKQDLKACLGSSGAPLLQQANSTARLSVPYHFEMDPSLQNIFYQMNQGSTDTGSQNEVPVMQFLCEQLFCTDERQVKRSDLLRHLWRSITEPISGLAMSSHRFRLRNYQSCFVGQELVDWFQDERRTKSRGTAIKICQMLMDHGFFEPIVSTESQFKDEYVLYRPVKEAAADPVSKQETSLPSSAPITDGVSGVGLPAESLKLSAKRETFGSPGMEPMEDDEDDGDDDETATYWFRNMLEINLEDTEAESRPSSSGEDGPAAHDATDSLSGLQSELDSDRRTRSRSYILAGLQPGSLSAVVNSSSGLFTDLALSMEEVNSEPTISSTDDLNSIHSAHLQCLLGQLLLQESLPLSWADCLLSLIQEISIKVVTDLTANDKMDIREYVWIKKVPGGDKNDHELVHGVVCSKSIAHCRMASVRVKPKILMLSCAIEYQRIENKHASFDPLIMQEHEYLKNFITRVAALKPDILLVEKSVSRLAQEMLLKQNITLVLNVKPRIMESIARCSGADILQSMEQVSMARLGSCISFKLKRYELPGGQHKTLMFFEGCPTERGCSVVLRGGTREELVRVKRIALFMIFSAYHLRLEQGFLHDMCAYLPMIEALVASPPYHFPYRNNNQADCYILRHAQSQSQPLDGRTTVLDDVSSNEGHSKITNFLRHLSFMIISVSPLLVFDLPQVLTLLGSKNQAVEDLPEFPFYSVHLLNDSHCQIFTRSVKTMKLSSPLWKSRHLEVTLSHQLVSAEFCVDVLNQDVAESIAFYRASGGTIALSNCHDQKRLHARRFNHFFLENDSLPDHELEENSHNEELLEEDQNKEQPDCFSIYNHQKIAVLFSCHVNPAEGAPSLCIEPWVTTMEYYGKNDISLGGFLERYCFEPDNICPLADCRDRLMNHVRYFAHKNAAIYFEVKVLTKPMQINDRAIVTWNVCTNCRSISPVTTLSKEAWSMSFGKYLELRFYGTQYTYFNVSSPCQHSLHQDRIHYFGQGNLVAVFSYQPIVILEVVLPPDIVRINKPCLDVSMLASEVIDLYTKADSIFTAISEKIASLSGVAGTLSTLKDSMTMELTTKLKKEKASILDGIHCLQMKSASLARSDKVVESSSSACNDLLFGASTNFLLTDDEVADLMLEISNLQVIMRTNLVRVVESWNTTLQEVFSMDWRRDSDRDRMSGMFPAFRPVEADLAASSGGTGSSNHMSMGPILHSVKLLKSTDNHRWSLDLSRAMQLIEKEPRSGSTSPIPCSGLCSPASEGMDDCLKQRTKSKYQHRRSRSSIEVLGLSLGPSALHVGHQEDSITLSVSSLAMPATESDWKSSMNLPTPPVHVGHKGSCDHKDKFILFESDKSCIPMADSAPTLLHPSGDSPSDQCNSAASLSFMPAPLTRPSGKAAAEPSTWVVRKSYSSLAASSIPCSNAGSAETTIRSDAHLSTVHQTKPPISGDGSCEASSQTEEMGNHPIADAHAEGTYVLTSTASGVATCAEVHGNCSGSWGVERGSIQDGNHGFNSSDLPRSHSIQADVGPGLPVGRPVPTFEGAGPDGPRVSSSSTSSSMFHEATDGTMSEAQVPTISTTTPSVDLLAENCPNMPTVQSAGNTDHGQSCSMSDVQPEAEIFSTPRGVSLEEAGPLNHRLFLLPLLSMESPYLAIDSEGSTRTSDSDPPFHIFKNNTLVPAALKKDKPILEKEHVVDPKLEPVLIQGKTLRMTSTSKSPLPFVLQTEYLGGGLCSSPNTLAIPNREDMFGFDNNPSVHDNQVFRLSSDGGSATRKTEKVKKIISQFLPGNSFQPIPPPYPTWEHFLSNECIIPVVVNEKDPASIVAYALSCEDYREKLKSMSNSSADIALKPSNYRHARKDHIDTDGDVAAGSDTETTETEDQKKKPSGPLSENNVEIMFNDGSTKFYCSVMFAKEFEQLRSVIFPEGEERYIRSLSRSLPWRARGGKSGLQFSKSSDDRFVIKQMSRLESESFCEFAPNYFEYIQDSVRNKTPTAMAKLFGVYRVGYRSSQTNALRLDVLVLENLFCGCNISKIYDLKGSIRSRYTHKSGKEDVFLDENLIENRPLSPLYVRPHFKALLSKAIINDTRFLSSQMVIDYSLLVGIDEETQKMVMGIIDYVRTYTWDKKLESVLKSSGLLGGQGKMPTIVSPEAYRTRFNEAMQRYFLMVPDKWIGFGSDVC